MAWATDHERLAAVMARDAAADGAFVYGVVTTGIYCRPSCPSRRARPDHLRFFPSAAAAEGDGLRACRRCDPQGLGAARRAGVVATLCRLLDGAEAVPGLDELAAGAGMSRSTLLRLFIAETGITPAAYAAARRAERARAALAAGGAVADAAYAAGYGSASRFYAAAGARLGMTPAQYRGGGRGTEVRYGVGRCSLGAVMVAATSRGVCAIELGDDPDALVARLRSRFHAATLVGDDRGFDGVVARVVDLVEQPAGACDLPLDIRGTAFQQRVWEAL
ncbi:MAG: bifunctional transcriptional activator/DNA repair enzyme AdaA, partial [Acidimicrobiales bacterium]